MAYFDYNATTPLHALALETLLAASTDSWANPSSPYGDSARVHNRLESARETLARLLGKAASEIVFSGGATEVNNAIIRYLAEQLPTHKQLAISPFEHPSVAEPARHYFKGRFCELEANRDGLVNLKSLDGLLRSGTLGAVSVMAANNESGVIQPWRELAKMCRQTGVLFHCDASQSFGKCGDLGFESCDFLVGCGHKFGGPKGVAFLALSGNTQGFNSQLGGGQESGKRGGTENVPAILSMVAALTVAISNVHLLTNQAEPRDAFEATLAENIPGVVYIGKSTPRLPNTSFMVMPRHANLRWVRKLDLKGFQVSTGSACATGSHSVSPLLSALGHPDEAGRRSIRVSSGPTTSAADWEALAEAFLEVWQSMEEEDATGGAEVISL